VGDIRRPVKTRLPLSSFLSRTERFCSRGRVNDLKYRGVQEILPASRQMIARCRRRVTIVVSAVLPVDERRRPRASELFAQRSDREIDANRCPLRKAAVRCSMRCQQLLVDPGGRGNLAAPLKPRAKVGFGPGGNQIWGATPLATWAARRIVRRPHFRQIRTGGTLDEARQAERQTSAAAMIRAEFNPNGKIVHQQMNTMSLSFAVNTPEMKR